MSQQKNKKEEKQFFKKYLEEVKNIVQLERQKQYSRQFDNLIFLKFNENYNPLDLNHNYQDPSNQQDCDFSADANFERDGNANQEDTEQQEIENENELSNENIIENCDEQSNNDDLMIDEDDQNEKESEQINSKNNLTNSKEFQIQNKQQSEEDKQIQNLKQNIIYYQLLKEQYLSILNGRNQDFSQSKLGNLSKQGDLKIEENTSELDDNDSKYKTSLFFKNIVSYQKGIQSYQINLQEICSSAKMKLQGGLNNSSIYRIIHYSQYLSKEDLNQLNYFQLSTSTDNTQLNQQLKQLLDNEKKLNYIQYYFANINQKTLTRMEENKILEDLMPSTSETKVIMFSIQAIKKVLTLLFCAHVIAQTQNFNVISINSENYSQIQGQDDYRECLQLFFESILQQRALQCLQIKNIPNFSVPLIKSLENIDIGFCYIQTLILDTIDEKEQLSLLKSLSNLPQIKTLTCLGFVLDTNEKVKLFNQLMSKLISAQLSIRCLTDNFDFVFQFSNLKFLDLNIGIKQQRLTDKKYDNFFKSLSAAKKMLSLKICFQVSYYSKKKNQNNKQKTKHNNRRGRRNYSDQEDYEQYDDYEDEYQDYNENQEDEEDFGDYEEEEENQDDQQEIDESGSEDDEKSEDEQEEEEEEIGENFKVDETKKQKLEENCFYKFFDHLSNLNDLKQLDVNIELSQKQVDSIFELLKKSKSISNFNLTSNDDFLDNQYYQTHLQQFREIQSLNINFKNILEFISNQPNLKQVNFNLKQYTFKYSQSEQQQEKEQDIKSTLSLDVHKTPTLKSDFNINNFSIPNLIELKLQLQSDQFFLQQLNKCLSSLKNTQNLEKLTIEQKSDQNSYNLSQTYCLNKTYELFQNLDNLKNLSSLSLVFNYDINLLKSLAKFVKSNKSLTNLCLSESYSYNTYPQQVYLGLRDFISNLNCSSLKTVQIYFNPNNYNNFQSETLNLAKKDIVQQFIRLVQNKERKIKNINFNYYFGGEDETENILQSLLDATQDIRVILNSLTNQIIYNNHKLKTLNQKCCDKKIIVSHENQFYL